MSALSVHEHVLHIKVDGINVTLSFDNNITMRSIFVDKKPEKVIEKYVSCSNKITKDVNCSVNSKYIKTI